MRKLASIQRVLAVDPIPGADAIESALINGWRCVTKKGEFAPGDLGLYLEIDAIPPDTPPFRFLWTPKGAPPGSVERPSAFRIRTLRLRGSLSQGLLLPLAAAGVGGEVREGDDLTDLLGVGKYEPPLPSGMGDARGSFPRGVPKTDEIRVQSVPAVVDELRGHPYVATLKCDGTSATFLVDPDDGTFHACSRNFSVQPGANAYWSVAGRLRSVGGRYALQGEVCGPGVQKNPLGLPKLTWFAFDAWDMVEARRLGHDELEGLCEDLELPRVPVVEQGDRFDYDLPALLALAEGPYPGTRNEREGIVVRSRDPRTSEALGKRLSFKVISNRYLLAEG